MCSSDLSVDLRSNGCDASRPYDLTRLPELLRQRRLYRRRRAKRKRKGRGDGGLVPGGAEVRGGDDGDDDVDAVGLLLQ